MATVNNGDRAVCRFQQAFDVGEAPNPGVALLGQILHPLDVGRIGLNRSGCFLKVDFGLLQVNLNG